MPWSHLFNVLSLKASRALAFLPQFPQMSNDILISQNLGAGRTSVISPLSLLFYRWEDRGPQRSKVNF